ncbi:MAG: DNA replication/repair protein RecF [Xanthomonadales bacterium]|nr:DNA replication/repair protein RecF [Xanthomonadales bacterium]
MRLLSLSIEQLRRLEQVSLEPGAGINFLLGDNGAGKTSVLEAIHLLACGRSFRGGQHEALVQRGKLELRVVAKLLSEHQEHTLGLERSAKAWRAKLDGQTIERLSELFLRLPVVCYEPDSHVLISGGAEHRRRFLDWALFHVEPLFITPWRRYQRALKQRNRILKQEHDAASLDVWDFELAEQGACLDDLRSRYLEALRPTLAAMTARFLPELGDVQLRYQRGWLGGSEVEHLVAALAKARDRDRVVGYSTVGAHRSDWSLSFEAVPQRDMFSRGQEKLAVLACLLAQAEHFHSIRQEWPVLLLDDLPSELDPSHLQHTLTWLAGQTAQAFVTLTQAVVVPDQTKTPVCVFHVEQGQVRALV